MTSNYDHTLIQGVPVGVRVPIFMVWLHFYAASSLLLRKSKTHLMQFSSTKNSLDAFFVRPPKTVVKDYNFETEDN